MGICSLKGVKECNGHSKAVPGGECFLRGPPETEGTNGFLSSLSSYTSQGPEPGSGHIFIWVWALKILVKTQIKGSWSHLRRKETVFPPRPPKWVCPHIFRNGSSTFYLVCLAGCRQGSKPCLSAADTSCASAYAEINSETQDPLKAQFLYFSMFSYKSQVAPYTEYAFFFLNIKIALHVKYGIITCLYENSE